MFDILSKLGEIKEKAGKLKTVLESKSYTAKDDSELVTVTVNGKKDITDIQFASNYSSLNPEQQKQAFLQACQKAQKESELFIISEFKNLVPNIPGMNIFG